MQCAQAGGLSPVQRGPQAERQEHDPKGNAHLREYETIREVKGLQSHIPDGLLRRQGRPGGRHRPSTQAQNRRRPRSTPSRGCHRNSPTPEEAHKMGSGGGGGLAPICAPPTSLRLRGGKEAKAGWGRALGHKLAAGLLRQKEG